MSTDALNFSQFRDSGKAKLAAIPPQRAGIIPAHIVGMTHHRWNSPEASDYAEKTGNAVSPKPSVENIAISSIHTTQPGINRGAVRKYLNRKNPVSDLPRVSRVGGQNWMIDGHSRTAAFSLGGATHIPAQVWNYDD